MDANLLASWGATLREVVVASDSLAAVYSSQAEDEDEDPQAREAAMLFAVAEGSISEDEDYDRALAAAQGALNAFRGVGDAVGAADSLRLIGRCYRLKAVVLRSRRDIKGATEAEKAGRKLATDMEARFRKIKNKRGEAAMLVAAAEMDAYRAGATASQQEMALRLSGEAIGMLAKDDDKRLLASALLVRCRVLAVQGSQELTAAAKEAVGLFRAAHDKQGEAAVMHTVAASQASRQNFKDAIDNGAKALSLYRELNAEKAEAFQLYSIASWSYAAGLLQAAREKAGQALSLFRELDYRSGWQAATQAVNVLTYIESGTNEKALAIAEEELSRYDPAVPSIDRAIALAAVSSAHLALGDAEKALELAEKGVAACKDLGDKDWEPCALHLAASLQHPLLAAGTAYSAAKLFRRVGHELGEGIAAVAESGAHLANEDYYDALESAQDALATFQKLGNRSMEAQALLAIASVSSVTGDGEKAVSMAKEAHAILVVANDQKALIGTLQVLAQAYAANERYDEAVVYMRQLQATLRERGDKEGEKQLLSWLASINISRKRPSEAVQAANDALKLSKQLQDKGVDEVQVLLVVSQANLAQLMQQAESAQDPERALARSKDKAMRPAEQAVQLAQAIGDKQLQAFANYVHGQAAVETMSLKEAEASNLAALSLFRECGDQAGEAAAMCQNAELHLQAKRMDKMREAADKALALALVCRDETAEQRARAILKKMQGPPQPFPGMAQFQMAQAPAAPKEEAAPAALQTGAASAIAEPEKPKGLDPAYATSLVKSIAAEAIGDADDIQLDQALMEVGLDSLGAITFRNKLQQETGMKLAGTMMFDYPTMRGVADHLVEISNE